MVKLLALIKNKLDCFHTAYSRRHNDFVSLAAGKFTIGARN
jgi:hypothetical protein